MRVMARRVLVLLLLCLVLGSCNRQSEKIAGVFKNLPVPAGAELLYEQGGTRQGSQDACFFTYKQYLYGTDQGFEQIAKFYIQSMDDDLWHYQPDSLVSSSRIDWERNGQEYRLSVVANPYLDFPKEVVAAAEERFPTVYFVSITYADRIARVHCLNR